MERGNEMMCVGVALPAFFFSAAGREGGRD